MRNQNPKMKWIEVSSQYAGMMGVPVNVIEYLSVTEILKCAVTGMSNSRIADRYGICDSDNYVSNVLIDNLSFSGWEDDLNFNPLALFNQTDGDYMRYYSKVIEYAPYMYSDAIIVMSYNICLIYTKIKELLVENGY